jgi:kynurenine 3-monooxygenase
VFLLSTQLNTNVAQDGSFTCTLFMPSSRFTSLQDDPNAVPAFFDTYFPGVTTLISPESLITSFKTNPHLPLISIKCKPYHYADSCVIVGDAAHAMVPFYGQGMNAGLEDVRVLYEILDKYDSAPPSTSSSKESKRAIALAAYSEFRKTDAHSINDLALENYTEMRASVTSLVYKTRKYLEEHINVWFPALGWATKYSRVSFGNERYSEIIRRSERQGRLLVMGLAGLVGAPLILGAVGLWLRLRRGGGLRSLFR